MWGVMFWRSKWVFLFSFFLLGSCSNAWRDFPNKSSDDYYLSMAEIYLDQFKFSEAIDRITPLLASQPENPKVRKIAMLSYAGRAGLRVLDLILELADVSNSTFFRIFSEHFPGANANTVADMKMALSILENYEDDPALRTSEFNLIAMFIHFGVIGSTLNFYGYLPTNVPKPGFDACSVLQFPHAAATDVLQNLSKAMKVSSYISGSSGVSSALSSLFSAPQLAPFTNALNTVCPGGTLQEITSCQGIRALINEGAAGIGIGSGALTPCP
jgi:hypothetical protein